jgi:hypothetical protein
MRGGGALHGYIKRAKRVGAGQKSKGESTGQGSTGSVEVTRKRRSYERG